MDGLQAELVQATTTDRLRLHGAYLSPAVDAGVDLPFDAVLCLHPAGSNFYEASTLSALAPSLQDMGLSVLMVNTRGHDGLYTTTGQNGVRYQGAAVERVDQCRLDVAAWIDFLESRDLKRIAVMGHSLGAVKAIHAHVHAPRPELHAVIAISPPLLSFNRFENSAMGPEFLETFDKAEGHVRDGVPDRLMHVRVPIPMVISAETYLEKYGRGEKYNILKQVSRITVPALFVFGTIELTHGGPAFEGINESVRSSRRTDQDVDIACVPGADHFYRHRLEELASDIVRWITAHRPDRLT